MALGKLKNLACHTTTGEAESHVEMIPQPVFDTKIKHREHKYDNLKGKWCQKWNITTYVRNCETTWPENMHKTVSITDLRCKMHEFTAVCRRAMYVKCSRVSLSACRRERKWCPWLQNQPEAIKIACERIMQHFPTISHQAWIWQLCEHLKPHTITIKPLAPLKLFFF